MKYEIIGAQRKAGEFTPKDKPDQVIPYDNLVLHCIGKDLKVAGHTAVQLKCKMVDAGELFASIGAKDVKDFVGHVMDFETSFGVIRSFDVVK